MWVRVDLDAVAYVSTVAVYNRADGYGDRLRSWTVYVGNDTNAVTSNHNCGNGGVDNPNTGDVIHINCGGVRGKFVWVYKTSYDFLNLAEV